MTKGNTNNKTNNTTILTSNTSTTSDNDVTQNNLASAATVPINDDDESITQNSTKNFISTDDDTTSTSNNDDDDDKPYARNDIIITQDNPMDLYKKLSDAEKNLPLKQRIKHKLYNHGIPVALTIALYTLITHFGTIMSGIGTAATATFSALSTAATATISGLSTAGNAIAAFMTGGATMPVWGVAVAVLAAVALGFTLYTIFHHFDKKHNIDRLVKDKSITARQGDLAKVLTLTSKKELELLAQDSSDMKSDTELPNLKKLLESTKNVVLCSDQLKKLLQTIDSDNGFKKSYEKLADDLLEKHDKTALPIGSILREGSINNEAFLDKVSDYAAAADAAAKVADADAAVVAAAKAVTVAANAYVAANAVTVAAKNKAGTTNDTDVDDKKKNKKQQQAAAANACMIYATAKKEAADAADAATSASKTYDDACKTYNNAYYATYNSVRKPAENLLNDIAKLDSKHREKFFNSFEKDHPELSKLAEKSSEIENTFIKNSVTLFSTDNVDKFQDKVGQLLQEQDRTILDNVREGAKSTWEGTKDISSSAWRGTKNGGQKVGSFVTNLFTSKAEGNCMHILE